METVEYEKYFSALKKAKTDNEKFAALLMIAKVTKESSSDVGVKRQILEAVGPKFISRLLKTKTVPEGCPDNIFKSVALSILSALAGEPDVACSPAIADNVSSFSMILLLNPSETDSEDRQLVDDTYQCLNSLCGTSAGQENIVKAKSVSVLTQVIVEQMYGCEKAMDILVALLSSVGPEAWMECEGALHSLMGHFAKEFRTEMSAKKFELCKTLIFLLTAMPKHLAKTIDPPWAEDIVAGLDGILRSKLGSGQREPALKLTAMLLDVCGIQCILPPATKDSKLFLLITHLSCVEVRMVLEDPDINIAFQKGRLLSSCYSILETIIHHMTAGPSLQLDDRQVVQLHAAMVGAFAAVLHFLNQVAADNSIKWGSVVLATVRVLGSWLAEETSALRSEVYQLLPFLVDISKKSVPPFEDLENSHNSTNMPKPSSSGEKNSDVIMDTLSDTLDKALHIVKGDSKVDDEDNLDRNENHVKIKNEDNETEQANECDKGGDQTLNPKSTTILESQDVIRNMNNVEMLNGAEQIDVTTEGNTEHADAQDSDKIAQSSEKHVSFNDNLTSDVDHMTDDSHMTSKESCNSNTGTQKHSSNVSESDDIKTKINQSSQIKTDDNNSATNIETLDKQYCTKTDKEKENRSTFRSDRPSARTETNSASKKGQDYTVTIDSYVNDDKVMDDADMSEEELQDLHVRVDIFRFLLPGLCHLTSEDLPRMVLVKEGILALLDLYMWRQWNLFLQSPQSREVQSSLVIICNILLNLVIIEPKIVVEKEEFCHILLLVVKSVLELEIGDCLVVWSHMVTLGLMLLRALCKKTDSFLEVESINRFFVSAVRFLSGAYMVDYKKKMAAGITISEGYRQTWDQICQTWFLSMQALCACVPLYNELTTVILKTGWVPALMKSLLLVKGRGVDEETRSCFLLLLTTVANNNKATRDVVREKGGEELARVYKSKDLEEALKKQ